MSKVHFTISLDPTNANEEKILKFLHLRYGLVGEGEMSQEALSSEIKYLLMSGFYLSQLSPEIPERLAHHLSEPDLENYLGGLLGQRIGGQILVARSERQVIPEAPAMSVEQSLPSGRSDPISKSWGEEDASISAKQVLGQTEVEPKPLVIEKEPDMTIGDMAAISRIKNSGLF